MSSFARDLRKQKIEKNIGKSNDLILILDDLYDTFNVGGMYRVGDAAGVSQIIHCGTTPVPPDPKILRASVGLCNYIPWKYEKDIIEVIKKLQVTGYRIIVLEQNEKSKPYNEVDYGQQPTNNKQHTTGIALVAGNETFGVKKEIIDLADLVVELPMYGVNKSLNVVVATGIVVYEIRQRII